MATDRNFIAAVQAIGKVMNKTDDVLLLLMTSHGEHTGFALKLPNETASELTPQFVAATLNNEGIKNRLVIVSACFSGAFVPPLANDDTIVLTAADAENTSFGCAPERDWTYFGDAFFRQSVRRGRDLQQAFDNARDSHQRLGVDGSRPAVESASALWARLGCEARAILSIGARQRALASPPRFIFVTRTPQAT